MLYCSRQVNSMKTIDVLGICLKDYSLKETIRVTEQYMSSGALRTVICVTAGQLVKAASDEEEKQWIESVDLVVYDDVDIIKKAEGLDGVQTGGAQNQEYLDGLLRRLAKGRYGIYLLAESKEELEALEAQITGVRENLKIKGRGILEGSEPLQEQADSLINDINNVVPKVVIARLALQKERRFLEQHRRKMNASVFLGLSDQINLRKKKRGIGIIRRCVSRIILKKRVKRYMKRGKAEE